MKKIAIVTGGSKGIGKAIAEGLLKKGYIVIVCSRSLLYKEEKDYLEINCDVTKEKEVEKVINLVEKKYARIDVLVNCAGLMLYNKITEIDIKDFDNLFAVNVKGVMLFCKKVIPIMQKQKSGYIINISSVRGITGAPNKGAYAASKFAVMGLTQTILAENKEYGIRATAICPGLVYTEQTKLLLKEYGLLKDDVVEKEDIVKTIYYLLSLSTSAIVREIIIGGVL